MLSRKETLEEILKTLQLIKRALTRQHNSLESQEITPSQWAVIRIVHHQKQTTVKEIAKELCISSSATTQLIDGLVEEGYIKRKEGKADRRLTHLSLSAKAKERLNKIKKEILARLLKMFKPLSDKELRYYLNLQQKITTPFKPQ